MKKILKKCKGLGLKMIFCLSSTQSEKLSEEQKRTAKEIDKRRGFSNFTQEERIAKLHLIYNEDILPFIIAQGNQEVFYECASCHNPSHFRSPIYETVPEDVYIEGVCFHCKKRTKVFHTFLYRHIVQKYGFIVDDWKKSQIPMTFQDSEILKAMLVNNTIAHIKEDIERLLKQGDIVLDSPLEKVFEEYKKDLMCELKDSGFDSHNEQHNIFIKKIIQGELDRRRLVR